ncbi:MAG TPA: TonB-dependent receptor [Longimicrobiaceae bacterium]|nr:TonB-dependent receptor [Longimicrobiaceae bacterium]
MSYRPAVSKAFSRLLIVGAMVLMLPLRALAQWPGEIAGRVTDARGSAGVEAATVELPAVGRTASTDGTGAFILRGLEPGEYRVVVRRAGFAARETSAAVRNGQVTRLFISLQPVDVALAALRVTAERDRLADGTHVGRAEIERSGARTAGDVMATMPGVVVRENGVGAAQTVSIRGSAPGAVLVLVDGVPANDPVTGEADLSTVPAHSVQSVTVLPGARTARYGPRAEAGVVLIETRAAERRREATVTAGSLRERAGSVEWGDAFRGVAWSVGGQARSIGGEFHHPRDPGDPTPVIRRNADVAEWSGFAAAQTRAAGGDLRVRGGVETLDRGIPGLGYAPSLQARETLDRGRASLAWRRTTDGGAASFDVSGVTQRVRFSDPAPPFGLPYDTRTRVGSLHLRGEAERISRSSWLRGYGAGVEGTTQRIDAGALTETAPRTRTDAGTFAHAAAGRTFGGIDADLTAEARADRDGVTGRWYATRALTLGAGRGGVRVQLANRSGFSPPSLGDQFFREGVAVAPNPDLLPERVPNEWELGASASRTVGSAALSAGASAYRGDVRGMIVWLPDFRFVWSPRNTNVKRRGVDAWADAAWPAHALHLTASGSLAKVTYDRPGADDDVQVAYRPRQSAQLRAGWAPGRWTLDLGTRYVGRRFPDPSRDNPLPGFWTWDAGVGRGWRAGHFALDAAVHIDRLLDERSALISGYPEPGRRARIDLRVSRAGTP